MKKGKFLSVLTSLAMTGSMMLSAIPFTASAATTDKVGLEMVSDKTSFTLDEVKAGTARTTVYVDSTTTIADTDQVVCLEFALKPDQWGTVDPINLELCFPNQLGTKKGYKAKRHFDTNATLTGSIWDKATTDPIFLNYLDTKPDLVYSDEYMPKAMLMSSSNTGTLRTHDASTGLHVAQFEVQLPTDLAEGTYNINFVDPKSVIGDVIAGTAVNCDITNAKGITITVGEGQPVTTTTTATTPAATTETSMSWNFVGTADLKAETGVKGAVGDTVNVPVYIDTHGKTVEGVAAKLVYDATALELVDLVDPLDADLDGDGTEDFTESGLWEPSNTFTVSTSVFLIKLPGLDGMVNKPELPIVIAQFKIKDGASGEYPISFQNTLFENKEIEVVQETFRGDSGLPTNYLKVNKMPGSIIVGGATTSATTKTSETSMSWNFIGTADLKAETGVKGAVGDTVYVPVYIDTHGKTVEGVAAKLIYDDTALELTDLIDPLDADLDGDGTEDFTESGLWEPSNTFTVSTSVFLIKLPGLDGMVNKPELPIVIAEFKIKDGASGEYPITFQNTLHPTKEIEVVQETFRGDSGLPTNYLKVNKMPGSIIVGDVTTSATTKASTTTTTTTKATTASSSVTSITSMSWNFIGTADLKAETGVKGAVGDTVYVPVYIDTHGKTVEGVAAKLIYDGTALELTDLIDPLDADLNGDGVEDFEQSGLWEPSNTFTVSTSVFLIKLPGLEGMVNNPDLPIVIAEFKIKDGASGEYPISFQNTLYETKEIEVVQETFRGDSGIPTNYLKVNKMPGSIIVGDTTTSATTKAPVVTETSISQVIVTETSKSDVLVTETSKSQVVVTETSKLDVVVTETSISQVVVTVTNVSGVVVTSISEQVVVVTQTSVSNVVVTETSKSQVVVTETSKSQVVVTETSKSNVVVTETSLSNVVVTQTSVSDVVVTQTSIQDVIVTVTNVSGVVVTSVSQSVVVQTSITNVQVVVTETSISQVVVTQTSISDVIITNPVTTASGSESTSASESESATSASVSIVFPSDIVDLSGNNAFWYFADETEWHLDAFAVEVNGEVVDGAELTFSAASPAEAYDGKNFDYEITVTYTHEDGTVAEATFTAKIGLRGDANLDHKANARDAATIARDLAQLYATKKTTLTAEDGFGIFLANSDFVYAAAPEAGKNGYAKTPTDYYGQYDLAVRDAATLSKWLSRLYSEPNLTLYEVAVLKK